MYYVGIFFLQNRMGEVQMRILPRINPTVAGARVFIRQGYSIKLSHTCSDQHKELRYVHTALDENVISFGVYVLT